MSITFVSSNPRGLLNAFQDRIAQTSAEGKITTWEAVLHNGVTYYTHKAKDWHQKAYLRPLFKEGALVFNIIHPDKKTISTTVYGYYHGHLTETFLNHFDTLFSNASSSALAATGDIIAPREGARHAG
jgi:hypothetical protein